MDVWDVRDISQRVRELPLEDQRQLLDTHFGPAWRKAFLGLSAVSTFPTAEAFFGPLLDPSKLFNHACPLVGRSKQVEQLHGFVDSQQHRVAILTGRGGIGKSKTLHAFSTDFPARHKQIALRFVGDELPLTPESLDDLPLTLCVVVVDDAHRREDLGVLLSYAGRRTPPLKLIFSSRPQGLDHLSYLLRNAGFDPQQVLHVDPVTDLTREEVEQLARQVLGKDHEHLAERLTAVTKDSPLVTLIGGRLLKEKQVEPSLLERDEDFRSTALSAFRDILIGDVGRRIEPELCRSLLNLIAAVAPIHPESQAFQAAAAEFLGVDVNRVVNAIAVLERHGVFLRRGYSVRITPDVLADHLLYNACLTSQGRSTGFAQRVFNRFFSICPTQVIRNLAELDWRVWQTTGEETDLLAIAWQELREEFEQSNNLARCTTLDLIKEVAYYQPGQVLELVEVAIHHPAPGSQSERGSSLDPFSQEHVRRKLPEAIRRIAYSIRHLPRCCDLLWELGRDDDRKLNPYPDHAMRVLTDLAGYDPDKHLAYNRVVLDAVTRWLGAPDAHEHLHSPLDVLDPMLAKTGTSVHGRRHAIMIRSFHCTNEWTKPVRDDALKLVEKCLDSEKIKVVLRALRSLDEALREPTPYLNMTPSKDERAQWTPDRLRLLSILDTFAKRRSHPIILMRVQEILRIATLYGSSDEVKQKARNVASAIPDSFALRLTRLLCQNYHDLCFPDGQDDDPKIPWQERQEQINRLGAAVATEFLQTYPEPEDGFHNLNDRFREMREAGREVYPWLVLDAISEANGTYSDRLCELVLAAPDSPLAFTFGSLVVKLRRRHEAQAVALIQARSRMVT